MPSTTSNPIHKHLLTTLTTLLFLGESVLQPTYAGLKLASHWQPPVESSDIWGWVDTPTGRLFVFLGTLTGTYIIEVTNPDNPTVRHFIPGPVSIWRDIKTWQHYAYISHDLVYTGTPIGIQIVDLSLLASDDSITVYTWNAQDTIQTIHNIWIDEKGYLYMWGASGIAGPGNFIAHLQPNPLQPKIVGNYAPAALPNPYVHDGYVRNDTIWAAHIYAGVLVIADISNRQNPIILGSINTPGAFAHNTWADYSGKKWVVTTDEVAGGYVTLYDYSNPNNIQELDRFRTPGGASQGTIPHNAFFHNGFLFISYYRDGVVVLDARDTPLTIFSWYDTSPLSGEGFNGCWGVYPYFDSIVVASDIEEGLFIFRWDTLTSDTFIQTLRPFTPHRSPTIHWQWTPPHNLTLLLTHPGLPSPTLPITLSTATGQTLYSGWLTIHTPLHLPLNLSGWQPLIVHIPGYTPILLTPSQGQTPLTPSHKP